MEAETAKNNKNELARSLLAKHFPTPTSKATSPSSSVQAKPGKTQSSNPKKLAVAQKVQAMKMRQRAIPGDPKDKMATVSLDQKLHIQAKLEGSSGVSVLWFRKVNASLRLLVHAVAEVEQNIIVGRAVDLLATHFKVRPVCAAFPSTGHCLCLKSLGLAPPTRHRRRGLATPKLSAGRSDIRRRLTNSFEHRDCIVERCRTKHI